MDAWRLRLNMLLMSANAHRILGLGPLAGKGVTPVSTQLQRVLIIPRLAGACQVGTATRGEVAQSEGSDKIGNVIGRGRPIDGFVCGAVTLERLRDWQHDSFNYVQRA